MPRDGALYLQLTGTDYAQKLEEPELEKYRELWEQDLISETPQVYRAEYLAAQVLLDAEEGEGERDARGAARGGAEQSGLLEKVRAYSADRYDEGYERGIHDADAAAILEKLLAMHRGGAAALRAHAARLAALYWAFGGRGRARRRSSTGARAASHRLRDGLR